MFVEKKASSNERKSFQIVIGLTEGYGTNAVHTKDEVVGLIKDWLTHHVSVRVRPCITGGTLIPGTTVYAWKSPGTGLVANDEEVLLFVGEVNTLYSFGVPDGEILRVLKELASYLGTTLNQSRMYMTYRDQIFLLQNDKIGHPTD